jgi:ABC-type multidrug transport system fused ATPase/permease subunit
LEDFIETEEERQEYEKLSNNYRLSTLSEAQQKVLNEYLNKLKLEKVIEACKAAQAHDFISAFPDGYHTPIMSLNNASLSGGQIQRTSIARALLRKPKLLLLDEASSALDTESEAKVQATLEKIVTENRKRGAAIVMIAHRLSTIMNADRIIVIKDGQKHQEGNHETLMQDPEGLYAQYVAKGFPKPSGDGSSGGGSDVAAVTKKRQAMSQKKKAGADAAGEGDE